jgi:quercetin dioxygenase-like cupin family protein
MEARMPGRAVATVQTDTPEVRVTEWRLAPGSSTGHHRHAYDYVVVPLTGGELTAITAEGRSQRPLQPGQSYFRKAGVEHDVSNETAGEIVFIEIEIMGGSPA